MIPTTMAAALLTGHGGLEKLVYRTDVPVPQPRADEVLIAVGAAGVNNTDINTRLGWYSKRVEGGTNTGDDKGFALVEGADDSSWSGTALIFPRIQGADVCGRVVAVGADIPKARVGERVVVRNMLRHYVGRRPFECWTLGSECDGGFAQYVVAPSAETFAISTDSALSDTELAAIPCAYSTAENMLERAVVREGETVIVTGASGGVGLAAVQLAQRRGANVIAIAAASKAETVRAAGAKRVIDRGANLQRELGKDAIDVVLDVVGGAAVTDLLASLRRGGRYAVAGAIGGPIAEVDLRTIYLRDLSIFGCTFQDDRVFNNLVEYIARGELRPLVSKVYELKNVRQAQEDFMSKTLPGKLVLVPPPSQLQTSSWSTSTSTSLTRATCPSKRFTLLFDNHHKEASERASEEMESRVRAGLLHRGSTAADINALYRGESHAAFISPIHHGNRTSMSDKL